MEDFENIEEIDANVFNATKEVSPEEETPALETVLVIIQHLTFAAGIGTNVWFLWQILRINLISKWYSARLVSGDLKILITSFPWLNICYNFNAIIFNLILRYQIYGSAPICVFKDLLHRFFAFLQLLGLFCIVRTGFLIARGTSPNTNRFQTCVELTTTFLILVVGLGSLAPYFHHIEKHYCFLELWARCFEYSVWLFLIVFIFIMSVWVIYGKKFADYPNANLIQLSCNIGILYFCFWLPLILTLILGEILRANFIHMPSLVYYSLFLLSEIASIIYPFLCLRQKSTLFDKNVSSEEVDNVNLTPYEIFNSTS